MAKLLESQALVDSSSRLVVVEEHAQKRCYTQTWTLGDDELFEPPPDALALVRGGDVDAYLGSGVVSWASAVE